MNTFYFVGSVCQIGNAELKALGQKISLTDEGAADAIIGGAALLSEEDFQAVGFTSDELRDYAYPGQRATAPAEFNAKMTAARNALHEHRVDLVAQANGNK